MNLLSGQTVFLNAVVTEPMRYIAVDREVLRQLLFEDSSLVRPAPLRLHRAPRAAAAARRGSGSRSSARANRARRGGWSSSPGGMRLPHSWLDPEEDAEAAALVEPLDPAELPLVRLPGGAELRAPTNGELSRALGIGLELAQREDVDLLIVGGGPAGLGAAVYGASEGLDTLVIESTVLGGQAGASRRIENYLGFPAGHQRHRVDQPRDHPGAEVRRPDRDALPRPRRSSPATDRHLVRLEEGNEIAARAVLLATGAEYRRLPVADLERLRGDQRLLRGRPAGGAALRRRSGSGSIGGGNSAGQAAVWLARGGALVTLLHRRADLGETMSHYLIDELERYGVAVRDRSEIDELARRGGELEAVTLTDGTAAAALVPVPLPRRLAVHRLARRRGRPRRERVRPDRPRRRRRGPARDQRPRRLRRRRRSRRVDQALRDRGRRGRDGRPLRPRAPFRERSLPVSDRNQ